LNTEKLKLIGWNKERSAEFHRVLDSMDSRNSEKNDYIPGRVIGMHREIFEVQTITRRILCTPAGRFRQTAELWPSVGDWLIIKALDEESGVIVDMLSRSSVLSRGAAGAQTAEQVIAANVDFIFIVSGLDNDFNLRRMERYITLAWNSGASPVIVLSKSDLVEDPDYYTDQAAESAPGVDIHVTSGLKGVGLDEIRAYLRDGKTGVLVGSSGSGKSTLINQLLDREVQKTRDVREGDQRGRHTTTSRTLFVLPAGGALIDTPGLREVGLWGDVSSLDEGFREIAGLAERCRFGDCSHQHEPGCAVLAAVEAGDITRDRYKAYMKQARELAFLADKQDALKRKKEWHKQITREIRKLYKDR